MKAILVFITLITASTTSFSKTPDLSIVQGLINTLPGVKYTGIGACDKKHNLDEHFLIGVDSIEDIKKLQLILRSSIASYPICFEVDNSTPPTRVRNEYQTLSIDVKGVNGVEVIFNSNFQDQQDCIKGQIGTELTVVRTSFPSGPPINVDTTYLVRIFDFALNEDSCKKPQDAKASLKFESFTNKYINGAVKVDLIIPKGYEVQIIKY